MKVVDIQDADMASCVKRAKRQNIVLTRKGKPVAMLIGVKGMDLEQLELSYSDKFWAQVRAWRKEKTMSRAELEKRLAELDRVKNHPED